MLSEEEIKFIRDNVPYELTDDQIKKCFLEQHENILETLGFLLNIPVPVPKEKTEWEKRREICDAYDAEMQKRFKAVFD